jgi:hypothetical protein
MAELFEGGNVNVEFIDFHTCCHPSETIDKRGLRLSRNVIFELESQILQGLTNERIVSNMREKYKSKNDRAIELLVCITSQHPQIC